MICSKCGADTQVYYMCDEETDAEIDRNYCGMCFQHHPCTHQHGEGCSTLVFEEKENEQDNPSGAATTS
jgi:hypothetical protein